MNLDLRYLGPSEVAPTASGATVRFSPNLARSRVFFDAELAYPIRFREAMSALHDVVVGDLRFKKRDKTAYQAWKKEQAQRDAAVRRAAFVRGPAGPSSTASGESPSPPTWRATSARCTGSTGTRACAGPTSSRATIRSCSATSSPAIRW